MGVIGGVFAVVLDFREVMLTSPPELAHCGGGTPTLEKNFAPKKVPKNVFL